MNSLIREMLYRHCFSTFAVEYVIRSVHSKPGGLEIKWYTSASGLCWWRQYIGWKQTYRKKIDALVVASKETVLEVDAQKSKYKDTRYSRLPARRTALFWAITQRLVVRRIFLKLEDETDRLSWNVGTTTRCVTNQKSAVPRYMVTAPRSACRTKLQHK